MYNLHRIARFIRLPVVAASRAMSVISVEPKSRLVDEKVKMFVSGLEPQQRVTLEAKLRDEKGNVFESHAHYIADNNGDVDVGGDSSLGGSYRGVEPMGLLWSMKQAPGQRKGLRLFKRDVTKPFEVELKCFDDHISPNKGSQQLLSSSTFQQWYMAVGVERVVLKGQRFRATLFIPPGDGPFPGLIELKGATAGVNESKASLLASRGFLTLNLTYASSVASGIVPEYFELDHFEEMIEWLCKHPKVLPGGIGIHAICFGSWIALLLASFRSDVVNAVIAVSPISFAHLFSFKYQGKMSEKLPTDHSKLIHTKDGVVVRYAHSTATEDNGSDSKFSAITPSERINCPLLLICGTEDQYLNLEFNARQIYDRMNKNGKGHLCTILRYPGAGHVIEPPYTPLCYSQFEPVVKESYDNPYILWGGESKAHAQAQEDSWSKILAFLRKNIGQTP